MLTADLKHVKSVDEFYSEIRSQQEAYHGEDYCAMHDAIRHYMKDCKSYKEIGTHQGGSAAAVMTCDHKPEYMKDVPRVLRYITTVLDRNPELNEIKKLVKHATIEK